MYRNGGATGDSDEPPAQDARATTHAFASAVSATLGCTANTAQWMCRTGETILAAEPYQPAFNDVCTTATQWIPNPIAIDNMKTLKYFFLLVDIGFIFHWFLKCGIRSVLIFYHRGHKGFHRGHNAFGRNANADGYWSVACL